MQVRKRPNHQEHFEGHSRSQVHSKKVTFKSTTATGVWIAHVLALKFGRLTAKLRREGDQTVEDFNKRIRKNFEGQIRSLRFPME
eukprot:2101691-Amphidinium_carterae.1